MGEEGNIGLIDFSELRKKNEDYNTISSKNTSKFLGFEADFEDNEEIMKSFKELREKLKSANRENQHIREEMNNLQVQVRQLHESQSNLLAINQQLKEKSKQAQQNSEEWRKKFALLKAQLSQSDELAQQLSIVKQNLVQANAKYQKLEEEKKKVIEISIEDKMNQQQKLNKLYIKKENDDKYIQSLENELSKAKEKIVKLECEVKKAAIKFDEEIFNKKWSKDILEKENYEKAIEQLQEQISELKNKNRKEKEKRAELEKRVIELEEISGLVNVKAEAYEGQVEMLGKKMKKMQRKVSKAKMAATKMINQRVDWYEKFNKSAQICDELINRVKRQLIGDMVDLAKSCEFRLNKLKENKDVQKGEQLKLTTQKPIKQLKLKSQKKLKGFIENHSQQTNIQSDRILHENCTNTQPLSGKLKEISQFKSVQITNNENSLNSAMEMHSLELKIRKERQEVQKRLKEKLLYRKIQVANSPQKGRLRDHYLNMIFQR